MSTIPHHTYTLEKYLELDKTRRALGIRSARSWTWLAEAWSTIRLSRT